MVIPRGDLLCWSFIDLLKFQISNKKKMNVEHRTLNIEHRMWMSLRSIFLIKLKRRRCILIRRWKFDVGRSFFNPVLIIGYWNLRFICNLVLGICIFRHKAPRQSHLSLTPAMRDLRRSQPPAHRAYGPEGGPGFSG